MASKIKVDQITNNAENGFIETANVGIDASSATNGISLPAGTTAQRPTNVPPGTMRWNTEDEVTEIWNGTEWTGIGSKKASGLTADTAALSGAAIKTDFPTSSTGLYWIKNDDMSTATQVYIDMDYDGGGWMLLGYGYVASTGDSSSNRSFPNLNHDGTYFNYNPTARSSSNGLVTPEGSQQTAVKLSRASTQMIFAAGGNPATGGIDTYDYVYRFNIPNPAALTFANHAYLGPNSANMGVSTVTISGLKGDVGSWDRACFTEAIGSTWSDTFPTGYGFCSNGTPRGFNADGGPFFPAVHSGHGYTGGFTPAVGSLNISPDVGSGKGGQTSYAYRGWYGPTDVNRLGQTSIWCK